MKKLMFSLLLGIMLLSFSSAFSICIDHTPPTAPPNLSVSSSGMNIILTWNPSTDEPSCSGIYEYVVSRDGIEIGRTSASILNFTDDDLSYGNYSYSVFAIDRVGHNSGLATKNDVILSYNGTKIIVSGGGGGSGYVCHENWSCQSWTDCIGNEEQRVCTDLNECGTNATKPITYKNCGLKSNNASNLNNSVSNLNNSVETFKNTGKSEYSKGFFSTISGAMIGAVGTTSGKIISIILGFILLILIGLLMVSRRRFRK